MTRLLDRRCLYTVLTLLLLLLVRCLSDPSDCRPMNGEHKWDDGRMHFAVGVRGLTVVTEKMAEDEDICNGNDHRRLFCLTILAC